MQSHPLDLLNHLNNQERTCALSLGILFLAVGLAGFVPGLTSFPSGDPASVTAVPGLIFDDGYGYVLGLFPTNFLHNAIHIAVGILGIAAASSLSGAIVFNRLFAIMYVVIALMGLLPITNTTFGVMPIFGNNVWFNALTAIVAGYIGFVKPAVTQAKSEDINASSPST
jgi:hypothetical protein